MEGPSLPLRKPEMSPEKRLELTQEFLRNVRLPQQPPKGFNPLTASPKELRSFGMPPRPDKSRHPKQAANWERLMSKPMKLVQPTFRVIERKRVTRPAKFQQKSPEAATVTSNNWSGAVIADDDDFDTVCGTWVVPNPYPGGTSDDGNNYYSAAWVGMDGWTSDDVLQGGTSQDVTCDSDQFYPSTYAWYEWYPTYPVEITNFPVSSGDTVTCYIWALTDDDNSSNGDGTDDDNDDIYGSFFIYNWNAQLYTSVDFDPPDDVSFQGDSAEWIMEDPSDGTTEVSMSRFGTIPFSDCWAYGGSWQNLSDADLINLSTSDGTTLCTTEKESDTVIIIYNPDTGDSIDSDNSSSDEEQKART
jgi:hypothetical protein